MPVTLLGEDTPILQSMPEVVPQVSFDCALGDTFLNLDFDYEGYADYLRGRGFDDQQILGTQLRFRHAGRGWKKFLQLRGGTYDSFNNEMKVTLGHRTYSSRFNNFIKHETEHHIDNVQKRYSKFNKTMTIITNMGYIAGIGMVVVENIDSAAQVIDGSSNFILNLGAATELSLASFGIAAISHLTNPSEIRARKAAKRTGEFICNVMYSTPARSIPE